MTNRQEKIFNGLRQITGDDSATVEYFKSALELYNNPLLSSRVSQLANAAREIDGGLRDILSPKSLQEKLEKSLLKKGIEKIFDTEFKAHSGNIASILNVLNVDTDDPLAKNWFEVSKQFHKYVHRPGALNKPRKFHEFQSIWEKYEEVLERLIGSYLAVTDRIDRLIKLTHIDDNSVGVVLNLIQQPPYASYFFGNLNSTLWFNPLKDKGIFDIETISFDKSGNTLFWRPLPYLERISEQVSVHTQFGKELINIIQSFVLASNRINNAHIWRSFITILLYIPCNIIQSEFSLQGDQGFIKLLSICSNVDVGFLTHDIGDSLLRKFLNDDSMLGYVEAIVDSITDIKPGTRKRALSDRSEAVFKWETHWVMDAFEKNAEQIGERSENSIVIIANKLKRTLEYDQLSSYSNIVINDDVYEVTATRVLRDSSNESNTSFEENAYYLDVKRFSEKQLDGKNIKDGLWALIGIDPDILILQPTKFMSGTRDVFATQIKRLLPSTIPWNKNPDLDKKLSQVHENLFEDYSQVWFKSLTGGDRRHVHDAHEGLTIILRDLLESRCASVSEKRLENFEDFLTDHYPFPVFKKFVLYFIDKYWDYGLDNLFDKFIGKVPKILRTEAYEVELHKILRNHNSKFTKERNENLQSLINDVPDYYVEHGEKYVNYWKYKWFSPLKESPAFKEAFDQAKSYSEFKTDDKGYHPEECPFQAGIVHHESALSADDIRNRHKAGSLVEEFHKFKKPDLRKAFNNEPDREGLGDVFKKAVAETPRVFIEKIEQYRLSPPYFVRRLLWGLKEAYRNKQNLDWSRILDFYLEYFSANKDMLSDKSETEDGDTVSKEYIWSIGDAAGLIEDGSNGNVLNYECFDRVSKFFDFVSGVVVGEKKPDTQRDVIHYAHNTTLGQIIRANVSFGLRSFRESKENGRSAAINWGMSHYDRYFGRGIEAYIWFGHYFPHIRYLDKEYTESKLHELAQRLTEDVEWQAFMEGYLIGTAVYDDIYALPAMRSNYEKAVDSDAFVKKEDNNLVHHIVISYLRGKESLSESNKDGKKSLFWKLLHNSEPTVTSQRWLAVAGYFWSISPRTLERRDSGENKESLNREIIDKIIDFWRWTYINGADIERLLAGEYQRFLAQLADLTIYLDQIDDENEKWLLQVAPHCNLHHMSSFFIEYLTKFLDDDDSMKRIGKIYLKILEGTTPDFRQEHIHEIINRLYKLKNKYPEIKDVADTICNTYAKRGNYSLRGLYSQNQI